MSGIRIVERITRVGVLGHLDELERVMREYCDEVNARWQGTIASDDMSHRMHLGHFLIWLRQRQRQSVAGDSRERETLGGG